MRLRLNPHLNAMRRSLPQYKCSGVHPGQTLSRFKMKSKQQEHRNQNGIRGRQRRKKRLKLQLAKDSLPNLPEATVVLKPLQFKEVFVSTPATGKREIYYTCERVIKSESGDQEQTVFDDWRLETIDALPVNNGGNPSNPNGEEKTLTLKFPQPISHMFDVNGLKDDMHSILCMITGQKMTSVVLDAYLMTRVDLYNSVINAGVRAEYQLRPKRIRHKNFKYLPVGLLPVVDRDQSPETFQANREYLPAYSLKGCVLIAPQYTCKHYYVAVFNFVKKSVTLYDSSWHFIPKELRYAQILGVLNLLVKSQLEMEGLTEIDRSAHKWSIHYDNNCAQQIDEYSCGVYAINYVENILKGKGDRNRRKLTKKGIVEIRTQIVKELCSTTRLGRQFLEAISN